jgi:diphthamide biosynthesis protein 3
MGIIYCVGMEKRPQIFCGGHQSGVGVRDRWDAAHCSDALEAIIRLREIGSSIAGHWAVRQVCCGLQDYSDRTVDTDRDNTVRMSEVYEEVEIEDMTFNAETQEYTYPCPCGDKFSISLEELHDGDDIALCPSCTLRIRVIFDEDSLPPLRSSEQGEDNNGGDTVDESS